MINYNKNLTGILLTDLGFQMNGAQFDNSFFGFNLIITNQTGKYLIQIPGMSDQNQMEPIGTYAELVRTIYGMLNPYLQREMPKHAPFLSHNLESQKLLELVASYFRFDNNLSFIIEGGPHGLQIVPNNEYTYTLMSGNIQKFKVSYYWNTGKTSSGSDEYEFEIDPSCICHSYLKDVLSKETLRGIDHIITDVKIWDGKYWTPFFGEGIKFKNN